MILSFSYKHAKDISSLEERNAATVHALEEALCRENALKIELEKLQNKLCAVTDEKDKSKYVSKLLEITSELFISVWN